MGVGISSRVGSAEWRVPGSSCARNLALLSFSREAELVSRAPETLGDSNNAGCAEGDGASPRKAGGSSTEYMQP